MEGTTHLLIAAGDTTSIRPAWNLSGAAATDNCLKMYIPLDGGAIITLRGRKTELKTGRVYLFNSTRLEDQHCLDHFDHCWIHFVPASPQMKQLFFQKFSIAEWPRSALPIVEELLAGVAKLTAIKHRIKERHDPNIPVRHAIHLADKAFLFKVQAFLTYLVGDCIETQNLEISPEEQALLDRLLPAIQFMEENYSDNPPIEAITETVFMSPSHFNRLFIQLFSVSPKKYLIRKRLTEARGLLLNTRLATKEIAARTGYENEFYFSKAFKKEYGVPPTHFRKMDY